MVVPSFKRVTVRASFCFQLSTQALETEKPWCACRSVMARLDPSIIEPRPIPPDHITAKIIFSDERSTSFANYFCVFCMRAVYEFQ